MNSPSEPGHVFLQKCQGGFWFGARDSFSQSFQRRFLGLQFYLHSDVSENCGTPKSSFLIRFSIINHPFWGTPIFGNTHLLRHFFGGKQHRVFLPATPLRTSSNCSRGSIGTASNSSWPPFFRGVATLGKIATTPISPMSKSPGSKTPTFRKLLCNLVGGFSPFQKYARQIGSFSQVGVENKNSIWNHHLVICWILR